MLLSQLQYDNAEPKGWDSDLSDIKLLEIEAIAEENDCSFEETFDIWLKQVNQANADMWELDL